MLSTRELLPGVFTVDFVDVKVLGTMLTPALAMLVVDSVDFEVPGILLPPIPGVLVVDSVDVELPGTMLTPMPELETVMYEVVVCAAL